MKIIEFDYKQIAQIIQCHFSNTSKMRLHQQDQYELLERGIYTMLSGINSKIIENNLYEKFCSDICKKIGALDKEDLKEAEKLGKALKVDFVNTELEVRELLGFSRKQMMKKSILSSEGYRQKFLTKYFLILGAMSKLDGNTKTDLINDEKVDLKLLDEIKNIAELPKFSAWNY
jgi:hypothetical protein